MGSEKESQANEGFSVQRNRYFGLMTIGIALVFVGILVIFVASTLVPNSNVSTGVVIFIGPFPIVFGSGPNSGLLILIAIILTILSLAFYLIFMRRTRKVEDSEN